MTYKWIYEVGPASIVDEKLFVMRKHRTDDFILPSGKPDDGDKGDLQTLSRELGEKLGCGVVCLYTANLVGEPKPQAEIEEMAWASLTKSYAQMLAPSIQNKILPFLQLHQKITKALKIKNNSILKPDLFGIT